MLLATKVQMWSALAAAAAALAALAVSVRALGIADETWASQRVLNGQQVKLNEDSQRRDAQVYSSRVAMWATVGDVSSTILPAGLDIHLQNRAPVPLHAVRVIAPLASQATGVLDLGDLPPCTIDTLRVAAPTGDTFTQTPNAWLGYTALSLEFVETGRRWRVTSTRLELLDSAAETPGGATLQQASRSRKSVGDCGEAS